MKNLVYKGIIIIILNLLALPMVLAANADKKLDTKKNIAKTGITIVQIHHILGPCKTYITPKSVKVDFSRQEWWLQAKAPKWNVLIISKKSSKYYSHTQASWKKEGLNSIELLRESNQRNKRLSKGKPGKYFGFDTKKYFLTRTKASYTCLDNWPHSPTIDRILEKLYNTPAAIGIPLFYKVAQNPEDNNTKSDRITYFASKQFENKLETFYIVKGIKTKLARPVGAKPVASERMIVLGKSKVKNLSSFYDAFREK